MTGPVLVTGGTGTLGRLVLPRLLEAAHAVRVLSRTPHPAVDGIEYVVGDLTTGAGIEAAVAGVATLLHCAGSAKGDEVKARQLLRAAAPAGVAHLIFISVVGADRIPITGRLDQAMFGYFGAKHAAERLIADSGIPFTTLRATQFHELALTTVRDSGQASGHPRACDPLPTHRRLRGRRPVGRAHAWGRRPGWCPTWVGRRLICWPTWSGAICAPPAVGD